MAQRALPPGAVRRRTAFGLFDVDGWGWASVKASFWFFLIIFLLGYLPDRAYYFMVLPTIDVGYNVISPINWCDARNRGLPCPAPAGAVVPWEEGEDELSLPQARTGASMFNVAENIYVAGGETPDGPTDSVVGTVLEEDSLTGWSDAAALPEPRVDAVAVVSGGVPYLIGGLDGEGNPTTTVFRATLEEGALAGWEEVAELALPVAISNAGAVAAVSGIYLFGGLVDGQPSDTVYLSQLSEEATPQLQPWAEMTELPLPEPRADATAVMRGTFVYVLGGEGPDGASDLVFFLALNDEGVPVVDPATGRRRGWGVSAGSAEAFALPEPRTNHFSFSGGGAIYVIGGEGPDGTLARTHYWAVPNVVDGTIPAWNRLDVTELPEARADGGILALGSFAYIVGGETEEGPTATLLRANTAPALPFFRLGLFGMTVPALAIPGEIGQELGLISAAGAGTTFFAILVVIGLAYSHPRGTMRVIERISRGRFRAPPEEEQVRG